MPIAGISLPKISLPKLDLGKIGQTALKQGVSILKNVAKDLFTPAKDGKNLFKPELNYKVGPFDIKLKNPVEALASKLLGKFGEELKKRGFSPEALAGYISGGKNTVPGTDVELPALEDRLAQGGGTAAAARASTSGAQATGGAPATGSSSGAKATGGTGSAGSVGSGNGDYTPKMLGLFGSAGYKELTNSIDSKIEKLRSGGKLSEEEMTLLNHDMQKRQMLFQMITQIMNMENETKKNIVGNLR
ncbi:MAG: hypothetical protein ACK4N5_02500 [Myxococcales bacterium]